MERGGGVSPDRAPSIRHALPVTPFRRLRPATGPGQNGLLNPALGKSVAAPHSLHGDGCSLCEDVSNLDGLKNSEAETTCALSPLSSSPFPAGHREPARPVASTPRDPRACSGDSGRLAAARQGRTPEIRLVLRQSEGTHLSHRRMGTGTWIPEGPGFGLLGPPGAMRHDPAGAGGGSS